VSLAVLRAELEARMPRYRDTAPAISKLGIGLDDAEFAGGVLWFGLIYRGGEGNPAEQERAFWTAWSAGQPGTAGTPPGPQPQSARYWTSTCPAGSGNIKAGLGRQCARRRRRIRHIELDD
jgi:hypothetical protein